jgi:hypothetical protein
MKPDDLHPHSHHSGGHRDHAAHEPHSTVHHENAAAHPRHGPSASAAPAVVPSLNRVAVSATIHCLTGCAIGEVLGMVIGTGLGWSNARTIAISVVLAFIFGYGLTMRPLLGAGLALGAAVKLALAADTASIAIMELVDNAIMLAIPGAMHSGLASALFWGSLVVALLIAGIAAFPVNRWLIARGRGHAVVHEHHAGHH